MFSRDGSFGQSEAKARERSATVLLMGRERVRVVLEPHLGAACALERANNIAQALAVEDAQPDAVAFEMLRQLPAEPRRALAVAVRREWLAVEFDHWSAASRRTRASARVSP
jgi:hypothetical protein